MKTVGGVTSRAVFRRNQTMLVCLASVHFVYVHICSVCMFAIGSTAVEVDSLAKLRFTEAALANDDPFAVPDLKDQELVDVIDWLSNKSPDEASLHRQQQA